MQSKRADQRATAAALKQEFVLMSSHVAVVGSVNMDLVLRCANLPLPGETKTGSGFAQTLGGKGANQAVAIARAGAIVQFIGAVGRDAHGAEAARILKEEGVVTTYLHQTDAPTGVAMIMVEDSGQNCIALSAGANACLSPEHIEQAAGVISTARMLVCQWETPMPTIVRALQIARDAGVPTLLNPAPVPDADLVDLRQVLPLVDILIPNEHEAAALVGHAGEPFDVVQAARHLRELGARDVVITLGARGALAETVQGTAFFDAAPAKVVDTTGAGDTFIGALAWARCQGASLHEAIHWGQQAAAISIGRHGAMASIPYAREMKGKAIP